jgi:hypothetical protein
MLHIMVISCLLTTSTMGGCHRKKESETTSLGIVSEMAGAAAKGDYAAGISIGENYLRDNPGDSNVLEQTAILTLAQAKQDQVNREALVARAAHLLERSVKGSRAQAGTADHFANRFEAARAFELAGDLSADKCPYYRRAQALNSEAAAGLGKEPVKLRGDGEASPDTLKEQSAKLTSDVQKRASEAQCGN